MIKLKKNDVIDVKIEKLVYGGMGLARYGSENFVVFVRNSVVDDVLKVKITNINKKFAHSEIIEIIEPSKHRIKPLCPIFNACGSCQNQNCDYDELINQKTNILIETFSNIIDKSKIYKVIKSPDIVSYRHKVQYPCRQTKNSKRVLMGYFRQNSHDLTNIKFCPMQPDIINKISQFIKDNYHLGCYDEKKDKGLLKNVLFRINSKEDELLLTLVLNCNENGFNKIKHEFGTFCDLLKAQFSIIKGIFVNLNPKKTNTILSDKTLKITGSDYIIETLKDKSYKIGPNSFFQVNPKGAEIIFDIVENNIENNSVILDAYGGVGAIGIYLKEKAKKITLVEQNSNAVLMAKENFKLNEINDFEVFEGDAKNHFINFKKQNRFFDYTILDPPRSGCDLSALEAILKISKNIIYVSCNPQTLKRDLIFLKENGFEPEFIQGVDLFPYTYHIECVTVLKKEK